MIEDTIQGSMANPVYTCSAAASPVHSFSVQELKECFFLPET